MCTGTSNQFNVAIIPFFLIDTVDLVFVCFLLFFCTVILQVVITRAGAARQ